MRHGSYAVVKELEYHSLKCVGKKIHGILFESATPHEKVAMLERFAGECKLLGGLHHPCIVQFLGVWFERGSRLPVVVMEYLHSTLSACLERYGVLREEISSKILNLTPTQMTQMIQTKAPGTPCYMPPEALTAKPKYTSKSTFTPMVS